MTRLAALKQDLTPPGRRETARRKSRPPQRQKRLSKARRAAPAPANAQPGGELLARAHKQALGDLDSPRWRAALRRRLMAWYGRHARDLPWRRTRDPYRIWVSEIMLQQTVVAAVVPYFERFLERFPDITVLASAPEQDVLRYWEGLGYYRRARQLHRAAQVLRDEHGGEFPRDAAAVRALPGIGRYTAGAILSIAFDQTEPILEANTVRLLARLAAYSGDPRSAAGQTLLWEIAARLLPRHEAGRFNQALMELGSQVCTPRQPCCDVCPLAALCPTRQWNLASVVPAPKPRPNIEAVHEAAIVVRRSRRVLLVQRSADERWAGLWDFPRFALQSADAAGIERQIAERVARQTGCKVRVGPQLTTIRHSVTRFRITLDCYAADYLSAGRTNGAGQVMQWVSPAKFGDFPLSMSARKLARLIAEEE